ncbi:MAG: ABC transporter permease subunit [Phycisphaerae bacterium]|nr:ABC transporter permease subunit [Phycisphaerae bacterium]
MKKLWIIAANTFTETLRQPIYAVIIISGLILLTISPSLTMYTLDEDIKLLRELGLSTLFLSGLFIAIFSAAGAITEEIETKTITTVLSKPVSRTVFVVGKFLGVVTAVGLAHYILTLAMLMAIRHGVLSEAADTHDWTVITAAAVVVGTSFLITAFLNYSYDWNFTATGIGLLAGLSTLAIVFLIFIDRDWKYNPGNNKFTAFDIHASILLLLAVVVLVALAVLFSTRCNVVLTLTFCVGIFLLGLISDWIFGRFADTYMWAKIGYMLVPNLQVFWASDAIYGSGAIPFRYLLQSGMYTLLYTAGILSFSVALFQRRQVG